MNIRTGALALLTAFLPAASASTIYNLWDLNDDGSQLVGLDGWGFRTGGVFGSGMISMGVNDLGGAQLHLMPGTGQAHLLAQLNGGIINGGGTYTLDLQFDGLTAGAAGADWVAGFSTGGPVMLGTLTSSTGPVYYITTADGDGPSLTLTSSGASGGVELQGAVRFCADPACETLMSGATGTFAFGGECAVDSDCDGFPGGFSPDTAANGGPSSQIYTLALPPEAPQDSPEVPEPATYLLTGVGLVGFALHRRRRSGSQR